MSIQKYSQAFIPTLKEDPTDAVVASHRLLVRAGFIRQLGAGIYSLLPLAKRSIMKIEAIVREEMNAIGGQEFFLPALNPAEVWKESGRWETMGDNMFRLKDRKGGDYCLGMTHEEIFTYIARSEIRSYRDLPQCWYQIQTKFRDEPRPKSGLLRVRQFTMKDAYSFDIDKTALDKSYEAERLAYEKIFSRCGLKFVAVKAHSGAMGGSESSEFMVRTDAGEDLVAHCEKCGYAANVETAAARASAAVAGTQGTVEEFATPNVKTIEDLAKAPYNVKASQQLKTLIFMADAKPVVVVVRGDDELHEVKLQTATAAADVRPAHAEEIMKLMGAKPGSLGAVQFSKAKVIVDSSVASAQGMVTGANKDGFHVRHVDVKRDILSMSNASVEDVRAVKTGDACSNCDGTLNVFKALEIGHIFKLGTRYSESMGATVLDTEGKRVPIVMGSYGIGVDRILAAAVELHNDPNGIIWPLSIAPYAVHVATLGMEPELQQFADKLLELFSKERIDVLFDERNERPGVKLKDADLLGMPFRIALGKRGLAEGKVEFKARTTGSAVEMLTPEEAVSRVKAALAN